MPPSPSPDRPRVVIVGAGFGGLQCARRLAGRPVDVLLLDRNNYHVFTPLLYQVASSLLNPSDIAHPVRSLVRDAINLRFRLAEVIGVDFAARRVLLAGDAPVPYDDLVLAAGSTTNFFGVAGAEGAAQGLKDLPEALALRNHVLACFERAAGEVDPDRRRALLTFVIVGGGPTGVEYAGALSELLRLVFVHDYPEVDVAESRIVLVEALDRLLPAFSPRAGEYARRVLAKRGVDVRLGTRVVGAARDGVELGGGVRLGAATLVWAAGVRPSPLTTELTAQRTSSGRLAVDSYLRLVGHDHVYAIGDLAAAADGPALPMLSAPAMQAGRHVAGNILRVARGAPPVPFRYRDKGIMATIGKSAGVAQIGGRTLTGRLGWLAWLFVHLYFLIGFRNRLLVFIGWAWNYLRWDRPIRLITRARPDPADPTPTTPTPAPPVPSSTNVGRAPGGIVDD